MVPFSAAVLERPFSAFSAIEAVPPILIAHRRRTSHSDAIVVPKDARRAPNVPTIRMRSVSNGIGDRRRRTNLRSPSAGVPSREATPPVPSPMLRWYHRFPSPSAARPVLLALCTACATDPAPEASAAPEYELVEVRSVGGGMDDGPDAFGRIGGVDFVDGDRLVVLDAANHELRLFDSTGRFLSHAGREGAGPGEIRQPNGVRVAPDGLIWIRDSGNSRYVRFRVDGDSLRQAGEFLLGEGGGGYAVAPSFDGAGRLIHVGLTSDSTGAATLGRFTFGEDGRTPLAKIFVREPTPDSIGQHAVTGAGGVTWFYYAPLAPAFLLAHAPGGEWARTVSSVPAVEWYDASGSLLRRLTLTPERVALSASERALADSAMIHDRQRAGQELPFSVPGQKQPLRTMYFDAAGRLWVEHSVADGAPRLAEIFDTAGERVGRVRWPGEISLVTGAVGRDLIAGVARDDLGVQRVVLLRLQTVAAAE